MRRCIAFILPYAAAYYFVIAVVYITLHLLTLKFICHLSAQSMIVSKSFCNLLLSILFLVHLNILVSSTNINTWPRTSC